MQSSKQFYPQSVKVSRLSCRTSQRIEVQNRSQPNRKQKNAKRNRISPLYDATIRVTNQTPRKLVSNKNDDLLSSRTTIDYQDSGYPTSVNSESAHDFEQFRKYLIKNSKSYENEELESKQKNPIGQVREIFEKKKGSNKKSILKLKCSCRFLCVLLSILGLLLLGILISVVVVAVAIKNTTTTSTTTTSTSTTTTTATTTSSTSSTSSTTTTTTSRTLCKTLCGSQTLITLGDKIARWSFENNYLDRLNRYNAVPINNPTFITNGYAKNALSLSASFNQYLITTFIPLSTTSFTIEAWVHPTAFPNTLDHSIFGLCSGTGPNQCLHLTIRKTASVFRLYFGFNTNDCLGNKTLTINKWVHVAFVFDQSTLEQSIYLNGILDNQCTSSATLAVTSGNGTIGNIPLKVSTSGTNFFQGYIDELIIVNRVRTPCEILEDASLVTCLMFDSGSELVDSGPNELPTKSAASYISNGHSQQAVTFNKSSSIYYQVSSLTSLGVSNQPFTISLWIRPRVMDGIVVHVSTAPDGIGTWCIPFIGFASNGSLVAQVYNGGVKAAVGPELTLSTMSHIVETWSPTNGIRLFINSILAASNSIGTTIYTASGVSNYATLGNALSGATVCAYAPIGSRSPFDGDIDDFRIHNRELTASEVNTLYLL